MASCVGLCGLFESEKFVERKLGDEAVTLSGGFAGIGYGCFSSGMVMVYVCCFNKTTTFPRYTFLLPYLAKQSHNKTTTIFNTIGQVFPETETIANKSREIFAFF